MNLGGKSDVLADSILGVSVGWVNTYVEVFALLQNPCYAARI